MLTNHLRPSTTTIVALVLVASALVLIHMSVPSVISAQGDVTDEQLEAASGGRTVRIGSPGQRRVSRIPLEVYVARVLAGEGEPDAPDAARQALAVAVRS